MFVFKNALKNLFRNKGRNILLAVIILAMMTATVVGLAINNTASAIINDYKNRFASEVVISLNIESLLGGSSFQPGQGQDMSEIMSGIEPISSEMYLKFGTSEYLDQTKNTYTATVYVNSKDDVISPLDNPTFASGRPGGDDLFGNINGDFILYGDYWNDFEGSNATRWLVDGEWNNSKNECLISSDLANKNSLVVGDTITITATLLGADGNNIEYDYHLTIAGIYYDNTDGFGRVNRRNEILTNFTTAVAPIDDEIAVSGVTVNATYYLKDPSFLEVFEAQIREWGLPEMYSVTTDSATYDAIVKPVESMKNITFIFLMVVLVLGGLILTTIAMVAIRERKYEIGTLRAIGMKKSKVLMGLLAEFVVITFVCTFVGLFIGLFVSQPVSDVLLQQQVEVSQNQTTTMPGGNFGGSGNRPNLDRGMQQEARPGTEALNEMKVTFDFVTILEIFGIAILLAAVPTVASAARITRYEPMKILSDRN